jgi:RNA polymerase sigma-70 factor (ECF subfamily)
MDNLRSNFDDISISRLLKQSDRVAFKCLFDSHFISLCRFADTFVKNHEDSEEIVLDVFTSIWEKREELIILTSWKSYLFQSVRNRALNFIRDNNRYIPTSDWSLFEKAEEDNALELNELEHFIEEAVCSLPDRCRDIFMKSRMENRTNKEIAEELNVSVKNVEAYITKALKLVKKYLSDIYACFW